MEEGGGAGLVTVMAALALADRSCTEVATTWNVDGEVAMLLGAV